MSLRKCKKKSRAITLRETHHHTVNKKCVVTKNISSTLTKIGIFNPKVEHDCFNPIPMLLLKFVGILYTFALERSCDKAHKGAYKVSFF